MRLVAITIGTLACLGLITGTIYFWGIGQVFPKYDHPIFHAKHPLIILPWSFTTSIESHLDAMIWVDVYATQHDTLLVAPWGEDQKKLKTREELTSPLRPLLVELLDKYPERKFILNVISNSMNIDHQILAASKKMIDKKNIAIQSEFDIVLRAMKEDFADLPYGSSQSDRLRFNSFQSMAPWQGGLLPAAPFRGDFYFAPLFWRKVSMISKEIITELHRRQKNVILGPLQTKDELEQAKGLGADGYLFADELLFKKFSTAHVAQ